MDSNALMHYGTKEHSGRYPWGSGENPYQRLGRGSIRARIKELKDTGLSEKAIAKDLGMSTTEMRQLVTLEKDEQKLHQYYKTHELKEKGYSNQKIAEMLDMSASNVSNYLRMKQPSNQLRSISEQLKSEVDKKKFLDVGEGANYALNCADTKLKAAIKLLELEDGYECHTVWIDQLGTNHKTTMMILCPPGTDKKSIYENLDKVREIDESKIIKTDGTVKLGMEKPQSVDRSRIMIRYNEDGGADKDGTIELRRGVDDISLGQANYAQVRIAVDDKGYMKGMAFYNDNMPKGVDIIYNSNKHKGAPDFGEGGVFKDLKLGDDNPFGATIKGLYDKDKSSEDKELKLTQRYYTDKNGVEHLSSINVVNEEGTWDGWSKSLSSQFLSKQTPMLAKRQLDVAYKQSVSDLEDILKLTEPTVKKNLLNQYAEGCDAAAVDLKAAALPRQRTSVILPVPSLKDNEVYAPNYKNGEHVCLVRHPHGGIFEIPELVVNNNHKEGKTVVGTARDAIGINIHTAQRLSGADFDGDTVLVLPSDNVKIKTSRPLKELEGFDPGMYAYPPGFKHEKMKSKTKQTEMGKVSNLITDMTIMGASSDKIARAVKHSMVVIDAEKHDYNWKQSEKDNDIAALKKEFQGGKNKGAATIVSRASSTERVPERKDYFRINPKTGEKEYIETGRSYSKDKKIKDADGNVIGYEPTGKTEIAKTKTTKMSATKDAMTLTSDGKGGYPMETIYANYANQMKALANRARREMVAVKPREFVPSAERTYAKEVDSLNAKLLIAKKNAPRERQAQAYANSSIKARIAANPEIKDDADKLKKIKGQALAAARARCGAKKEVIRFTDREWEAIQSGAIRKSKLEEIINNADKEEVKRRSMPKAGIVMTAAKLSTIKALANANFTQAEIADRLGISASAVNKALNG